MQMQAYSPITLHWNKSSQHCFLLDIQIIHTVMVVLFQRSVDTRRFFSSKNQLKRNACGRRLCMNNSEEFVSFEIINAMYYFMHYFFQIGAHNPLQSEE